jgi:SAM-dependent MidA family methyltransferase
MSNQAEQPNEESDPRLSQLIARRIEREGPITFATFMQIALYEPGLGYYTSARERIGWQGDFYTSPDVSPIFGGLIAKQLAEMWRIIDSPPDFTVVEMGAGKGLLCRDILDYLRRESPDLYPHLHYLIDELSPDFIQRQQALLASVPEAGRVDWLAPGDLDSRRVVGSVISNELLDAFPVHVVLMLDGRLREIYVGLDRERLVEVVGDLSDRALEDYFEVLGLTLAEGQRAEVNLAALDWIRRVAKFLEKGFVLTVDYGYEATELYSPRRTGGTFLCYYKHSASEDPYRRLGCQDMTTHVDFTSLTRVGEEEGLAFAGLTTQADFLTALGVGEFLTKGLHHGWDTNQFLAVKQAVFELVRLDGMGRNRVLVQYKNVQNPHILGLRHLALGADMDPSSR